MKKWLKKAGITAIKTMAETTIAVIGTNTLGIAEIDWLGIASTVLLSGIVSVLTCIKEIPEIKE